MSLPFSPGLIRGSSSWVRKTTDTAEAQTGLLYFVMPNATSDAAPSVMTFISGHAYAQASSNTTGAALRLAPGIGRRFITIDDYAQAGTGTVTVTVNGTATVLTAGTDFTAATSNAVTATNLATAIEAIAGVSATASSAVVYVTPDDSTYTLTLARSVAAFATVTTGTNGAVYAGYGDLLTVGPTNVTVASGATLYLGGTATYGIGQSTNFTNLIAGGNTVATVDGSDVLFKVVSAGIGFSSTSTDARLTPDTFLDRPGVGIARLYGASTASPATLRLGNTNVGYEDFARNTEAHTLAAAGTSTTATAVWPANSASQAASFRITTEITGCTSVQVGVSGDVTRYGTFSTLTAGQTIAIGRIDNYAAQTGILFTAVGGGASFTAGVIRVNLRYVTASAPTS